jgi:hypothetical protein
MSETSTAKLQQSDDLIDIQGPHQTQQQVNPNFDFDENTQQPSPTSKETLIEMDSMTPEKRSETSASSSKSSSNNSLANHFLEDKFGDDNFPSLFLMHLKFGNIRQINQTFPDSIDQIVFCIIKHLKQSYL